jgi:hypothetical protein
MTALFKSLPVQWLIFHKLGTVTVKSYWQRVKKTLNKQTTYGRGMLRMNKRDYLGDLVADLDNIQMNLK